ncbi:LysR family transcriptional regulator [Diaphorobacter sp. HDW4A]|uniref:LysR family transcriptional regulator n=1 Tax=Diaphorobacter sp. HDW4A TaxID=2714924 RepID=UPI00140C0D14|nr:LysR family transcriptional regulator [Diaphorobacter sp. HDW4A]QIL80316.1 LysR family transcriptional regulator [Diaphorobacter sp. HDW4A]
MRNLNLDQLQTLIAIGDLGTFAAAAQALHLAAPTVSLHIKELETRLDAALLVRGRRHAELTPAGRALVDEGRKLLLASDDLMELVKRRATGREGVVRVGMSAGVSTRLLPLMLETLISRSPGVEVRLEALGTGESIKRLQAGALEIGIVASPQAASAEVKMIPWRNDPMVAVLPSSWNPPERITPAWLASRRWASFAPATQMHGLISSWFAQAGQRPRPFLTMSYPGALISMAVASQSAALLPLEIVDEQQLPEHLVIRHLSPALMRPMAIAHRVTTHPNPAVESVLAVITEYGN